MPPEWYAEYVVNRIAIEFLDSLGREGHRNHPGSDIREIEVVAVLYGPCLGTRNDFSEPEHSTNNFVSITLWC